MKLGISAFAWTAKFTEDHLTLLGGLREHQFRGLEIPMFDPLALPAASMRRAFEANAMDCTVCAILPIGINPISPDASIRKQSLTHLMQCVETTAAMGGHLLGGPVYAPIGYLPGHRRTRDEWTWAVECFQALCERLEAYDVVLSIEPVNRSETFFLNTAEEARRLCEAIGHPRVGVTLDTFHANIEEKNIGQAVRLLGVYLKHLHLSENDRGLLGSGHVNFREIVDAAAHIGYGGYLIIEGFGYSAREPQAPGALLASLAVSPEDIAYQGAAYLQSLLA
jgi:D-psicose/D-tagatose/L-ribulose 3-epimerase